MQPGGFDYGLLKNSSASALSIERVDVAVGDLEGAVVILHVTADDYLVADLELVLRSELLFIEILAAEDVEPVSVVGTVSRDVEGGVAVAGRQILDLRDDTLEVSGLA